MLNIQNSTCHIVLSFVLETSVSFKFTVNFKYKAFVFTVQKLFCQFERFFGKNGKNRVSFWTMFICNSKQCHEGKASIPSRVHKIYSLLTNCITTFCDAYQARFSWSYDFSNKTPGYTLISPAFVAMYRQATYVAG